MAGGRGRRARRRGRPASRVRSSATKESGVTETVRARYRGRGRWRQLPVRSGARHRRGPFVPQGMAIRGYFTSPFHDEPWIESHLDLRDPDGNHLPGYGWIFPVGDGTVNVGVGLLSTFSGFKHVNTTPPDGGVLRDRAGALGICADTAAARRPAAACRPAGRCSRGSGRRVIVAGDAAGFVNPFNGEGIADAYETGRLAADAVDRRARGPGDGLALRTYADRLEEIYGLYFKVARVFVRAIGNPAVMRELTRVGMHSRTLMEWVLRIMANLLRPDELGPAEAVYRAIAALVRLAPEP